MHSVPFKKAEKQGIKDRKKVKHEINDKKGENKQVGGTLQVSSVGHRFPFWIHTHLSFHKQPEISHEKELRGEGHNALPPGLFLLSQFPHGHSTISSSGILLRISCLACSKAPSAVKLGSLLRLMVSSPTISQKATS